MGGRGDKKVQGEILGLKWGGTWTTKRNERKTMSVEFREHGGAQEVEAGNGGRGQTMQDLVSLYDIGLFLTAMKF